MQGMHGLLCQEVHTKAMDYGAECSMGAPCVMPCHPLLLV